MWIRVGKSFWDGQPYIMSVHNYTGVNSLIGTYSFMCRAAIHISVTSQPHTHTQCLNMYFKTCIKECFCRTKATLEGISLVCCITVQCMFSLVQITSSNVETKNKTKMKLRLNKSIQCT